MSDDKVRALVVKFLRGNSPAGTREVRAAIPARAVAVDRALRALLSDGRVVRTDEGWCGVRSDGTRRGHAVRCSGAQVSYHKATDAVQALLAGEFDTDPDLARWLAHMTLLEILPARQRARLVG